MSQVKIILNGEDYLVKKDQSIVDLIEMLDLDIEKIAIEKNLEIVLPADFKNTQIQTNDRIEIVSFIGGG
jgi:thiamine biosynthesis protein ThiS